MNGEVGEIGSLRARRRGQDSNPRKKSSRRFLVGGQASEFEKYWKMKPGEICLSSVEAESLKENVWRWVDKRKRWMDWPCRSRLSAVTSYCTALGSFVEPGRVGETKEYKGTRKPRR